MPRPKNADRTAVTDATLTSRFTAIEIARINVLLAQRLAQLHGTGAKLTAGGLVRAIVVSKLDELGIEPPPGTPMQPTLPGLAPAPPPGQGVPAATPAPPAPFWYGITDTGSSVEWIQPRQANRDEMEKACRDQGVTLRGPFETRQAAWTAFDREREEKQARAVPPPPPPPQATAAAPTSASTAATAGAKKTAKKTPQPSSAPTAPIRAAATAAKKKTTPQPSTTPAPTGAKTARTALVKPNHARKPSVPAPAAKKSAKKKTPHRSRTWEA